MHRGDISTSSRLSIRFLQRSFTLTSPFSQRPMRVNANLGHWLTSFGHTVDANIFLEQDDVKLFVAVHTVNDRKRLVSMRNCWTIHSVLGQRVLISPRAALWLQPDPNGSTARERPGGLLAVAHRRSGDGAATRSGGQVDRSPALIWARTSACALASVIVRRSNR
jgi:hypothetical protein